MVLHLANSIKTSSCFLQNFAILNQIYERPPVAMLQNNVERRGQRVAVAGGGWTLHMAGENDRSRTFTYGAYGRRVRRAAARRR